MAMWKYFFDNELFQRMDIERLEQRSDLLRRQARRAHRQQEDRLDDLEQDFGELALLCRALVAVLKEKGGVDDEALHAALQRIDAEDGVIDGRVTHESERPRTPVVPPTAAPNAPPPVAAPIPHRRRP